MKNILVYFKHFLEVLNHLQHFLYTEAFNMNINNLIMRSKHGNGRQVFVWTILGFKIMKLSVFLHYKNIFSKIKFLDNLAPINVVQIQTWKWCP
jgi:hypothetical protein